MSRASLRSSEAGSSAVRPRTVAAAKKASLAAKAAALKQQQNLQEEELRLKYDDLTHQQQQEQARLLLEQRKKQFQLQTEIAKVDAEERVYAVAEQGAQYVPQPPPMRSQDPSQFSPPTPSRPPDQFSEGVKPTQGFIKVPQVPGRSEELKPDPKQGTPWTPVILPKPGLSDGRFDREGAKQEGSPSPNNSDIGEKFVRDMIDIQQQQQQHNKQLMHMQQYRDQQLQQLLGQHQQLSLTLTLPHAEVQTFDGDPVNYCNFIRSFKNLIEAKTKSSSTRLYYLLQYTSGDVQELMQSCLSMRPDEGYQEARRLLKERYGQGYKIASAYITRVTNGPPIKNEDGHALQKFSVLLTSCKNTLKEIGYLNKIENQDSLQKVVERLPFQLRQRWRDVADDIRNNKQREITFEDIARFVESKARALNHPVFGAINAEQRNQGRTPSNRRSGRSDNFATLGGELVSENGEDRPTSTKTTPKCHLCKGDHWLTRRRQFNPLTACVTY